MLPTVKKFTPPPNGPHPPYMTSFERKGGGQLLLFKDVDSVFMPGTLAKVKNNRALGVMILILVMVVFGIGRHHRALSSSDAVTNLRYGEAVHHHRKALEREHWVVGKSRDSMIGDRVFPAKELKNLILVACHSVYTGVDFSHPEDQSSWLLLDYQKIPGQTESFLSHIKLGIERASDDESSMLLFSGGQTRREAGPRAEAMGYWMVAEANGWFGMKHVRRRAYTEEHARDSFENFSFGLCRFFELTGHYPEHVSIVSYEFKQRRFVENHREALSWPLAKLSFIGTPALTKEAIEGEEKTRNLFKSDPYGCGSELGSKRSLRDPFAHGSYPPDRCPAMASLLQYCGTSLFSGSLPWS